MAWETDYVLMLRVLINDLNTPQKNTDSYLQQVLVCAGIYVQNDIDLTYDYVFDVGASTISPDPLTSQDYILQALLPLKAACILNQGSFQTAIGQGIRVRDGDSMIDTSVSFRGYRDILELGPCASYDKLKFQIQAASVEAAGFVLSPYREPDVQGYDTIAWYYDEVARAISTGARERR